MPTTNNISEFWNQVDDPLFSEEMVLSKISLVAKKAMALTLQRKPPNIGGHLFTVDECKEWYLNSTVTKEVLKHLATVNQGDDYSDRITKQMNLVEVTFDQKTEESVMTTTVSVLTHLDEKILPALTKSLTCKSKWLTY